MPEARPSSGAAGHKAGRSRNRRSGMNRRLQAQQQRAAEEAPRRSAFPSPLGRPQLGRPGTPGVSRLPRSLAGCVYRCPIGTRVSCISESYSSHRELEAHIMRSHTEEAANVWKYVSSPERMQGWQGWAFLEGGETRMTEVD